MRDGFRLSRSKYLEDAACGGGGIGRKLPWLRVRRETGRMMRMKESYVEGLATHNGPESCVVIREGGIEALTGVCIGRVLSRESVLQLRRPTSYGVRKATRGRALLASPSPLLRGLRPRACAESSCAGTGRSPVWSWPELAAVIRNGNPIGATH